jgi:hypothetical protein
MSTLRHLALVSLGIAFCVGCSESQQSWEGGKSQSSAHKQSAKADDVKENDATDDSGSAENPHKTANPHGNMPMAGTGAETKVDDDGTLNIEPLHFTVPKAWIPKPHNSMLQAEFAIPKAEGDKADGRLTVSMAGGTVESNVERWKGQFGEKPEKENEETITAGGIKIMLVDFSGTFADSMGPMAPAVNRPDYRMLGAIFEVPGSPELHFVKCTGPTKTITAHADEIKGFLKSLKVDK